MLLLPRRQGKVGHRTGVRSSCTSSRPTTENVLPHEFGLIQAASTGGRCSVSIDKAELDNIRTKSTHRSQSPQYSLESVNSLEKGPGQTRRSDQAHDSA